MRPCTPATVTVYILGTASGGAPRAAVRMSAASSSVTDLLLSRTSVSTALLLSKRAHASKRVSTCAAHKRGEAPRRTTARCSHARGARARHSQARAGSLTSINGILLICFPRLGHVIRERIVRVGRGQQGLDGEEDGADLQRRAPLVLQDVQADAPQPIDVRVIDLGEEAHLRRGPTANMANTPHERMSAAYEFGARAARRAWMAVETACGARNLASPRLLRLCSGVAAPWEEPSDNLRSETALA